MVRHHRLGYKEHGPTQDVDNQHIHPRHQLIRQWVQSHCVSVIDDVDYFLGASAF